MMLLASGSIGIGGILGVVGVALTIVAILGAALAYFKASYTKATIETLQQNNTALTDRVDLLETGMDDCLRKADALQKENDSLRTYVSGTEAIKDLGDVLLQQHTETMAAFRTMMEKIPIVTVATRRQASATTRKAPARKATR